MDNKKITYSPNFAVHPGETLKENLDILSMSNIELSNRIGISEKHISQIINGSASITPETAIKLEKALEISADFWNNLQSNYNIIYSRIEAQEKLQNEIKLAKKYNYLELIKYGLVQQTSDWIKRVESLQSFFKVSSLEYIPKIESVAFRKQDGDFNTESLSSWLRFGEIESKKIKLERYDKDKLKESLVGLKKLTYLPKDFYKKLQEICASCGVAVVYTPYFKNTKLNGAVRYLGDNPLIQLNSKGVYSDIFWFTFFHEIGHILLHNKGDKFLEFDSSKKDDKENEADKFASEFLIPNNKFKELIQKKSLSVEEAKKFSNEIGVGFDVLVGRFCYEKLLTWQKASRFRKSIVIN